MMNKNLITVSGAMGIYLLLSSGIALTEDEFQLQLNQAKQLLDAGKPVSAISHYEQAITTSPNDARAAELWLKIGSLYGRKDLSNSAIAYCKARDLASGQLRLQAANNCATQNLRLGDNRQALKVMQNIWNEFGNSSLAPRPRSRVLYNYALALEKNGRDEMAQSFYQQSFEADPGFDVAAQAISRIALSSESERIGIPEMLKLVDGLILNGKFDSADEKLKQGLFERHWQGHPEYPRLITQLTQYLAASRTTPSRFESQWHADLNDLSGKLPLRDAERIKDIEQVYLGDMTIEFDIDQLRDKYRAWYEADVHSSLSALVKLLGDFRFRNSEHESALAYYVTAWTMDTTNMDAGLYAANLLASDEGLQNVYLDQFLDSVFGLKGIAYLGQDWPNILRFHTVLGGLFEKLERWGSEWDARSAIFQWQHAILAIEELVQADPARLWPTAGLREHLAISFAGNRQWSEAWNEYLLAAEEYISSEKPARAQQIMRNAKSSLPGANTQFRDRINQIEQLL